jgi:hypothetical protein
VRRIRRDLSLLLPGEQFGLQASSARVPALRLAAYIYWHDSMLSSGTQV